MTADSGAMSKTSRRGLLLAAPAMALALPGATIAGQMSAKPNYALEAELTAVMALRDRVNTEGGADDATHVVEWENREDALTRAVIALPATAANAALKARALLMLHEEDAEDIWPDNPCLNGVLVRQIVAALGGGER